MASYLGNELDAGRHRAIGSHTEVGYVNRHDEMAAKSRKRKHEDSPPSSDGGNRPSGHHSNRNDGIDSDYKDTNRHELVRERDGFDSGSNSKRSKHDFTDEFKDREAAQTEYSEQKGSRESPSKKSRKSSPSKHKKHKHKKSRSRERESRRESDSQSKRDRDSSKRSRSPRKKSRDTRSSSQERNVKISPERRHNVNQSERDISEVSDRKFRIPKKKRSYEDDKDSAGISKKNRRYEDDEVEKTPEKKVRTVSSLLRQEIADILRTEHHHVIRKSKSDIDGVPHVVWCYYYLDPKLPGHITGGRAHLHHFCRICKRTCLHLLGKYGTGQRKCLVCAADEMGWKEEEVPSWYFHDNCEYCKNDTKRGQGGRGGFRGGRFGGGYRNRYDSGYGNRYSRY